MNSVIDLLFQTLGPILFITLIIYGFIRFRNLKFPKKGIAILGILLSLICAWYWMDTGLKLKSNERFFVERKEGKYSNFTDKEAQEKLAELKQGDENARAKMTLFGIGFLIITGTTLTLIWKEKIKPVANKMHSQ